MMMRESLRGVTIGGAALALSLGLGMAGCVGYSSYEPHRAEIRLTNPGQPATQTALEAAVRYAATRYPPNTPPEVAILGQPTTEPHDFMFAVNMPRGMSREQYLGSVGRIGGEAVPLTPERVDLPIYHVGRVWVRGGRARIDIFRPVPGWRDAEPDDDNAYQALTLTLEGGHRAWRVTRMQARTPGAEPLPPLHFLPEERSTPEPRDRRDRDD